MDKKYAITEVFRSPQGEGHFVGYRMVFVRLAGCSVRNCFIRAECDEAPWKATARLNPAEVVDEVRKLQTRGRVCITGGEPSDHDLVPLVCALKDAGYLVHMETSGVRLLEGIPIDWLTVSPKTSDFRQRHGQEMKLVVRPQWHADPWAYIRGLADDTQFFHYYLQPLYRPDGLPVNLDFVLGLIDSENNNGKWALSEQRHKSWGVK